MTSAPARFTPAASGATRSSGQVGADRQVIDLYLHRCERRPQFMRGVGQEALLRLQGRPQSFDEPVHARDQRRHFRRHAFQGDRLFRHGAPLGDFIRQFIEPSEHAIHSPPDNEPGERDHDQDRRGGSDGRALDNFRANRFTLGDLDGAAAVAGRVDVPEFAIGYYIGKARAGLSRNVDAGKGLMDHVAVRVPYRNGELIFGIAVSCRRARRRPIFRFRR